MKTVWCFFTDGKRDTIATIDDTPMSFHVSVIDTSQEVNLRIHFVKL